MIGRPRSFSAALTPAGTYLVAYRRRAGGIEVVRESHDLTPGRPAEDAVEGLARLIAAAGGRGGRLSLAISGFGVYHQILSLPRSSREVLVPVVYREMRRFFPDLAQLGPEQVLVDYVEVGGGNGAEGAQVELLAAAAPRPLLELIRSRLAAREIELEHWTILPRALQRLYDAFSADAEPTAALVMAPGLPLLGFFHEGALRLYSEPPLAREEDESRADAIIEYVQRGALYVRQQFKGTRVGRVLLSAEPGREERALWGTVRERMGVAMDRFGPYSDSPAATVAVGAALDAGTPDALNLLPPDERVASAPERASRTLGVASLAVLVVAGIWWAISGLRAESSARHSLLAAERSLESRAAAFAEVRQLVSERQAHTQRAELLLTLRQARERIPELLWPLDAAGGAVAVHGLRLSPTETGWSGTLEGSARGITSAEAVAAVNGLYRDLQRELAGSTVSLDQMSYTQPLEGTDGAAPEFAAPIAVAFQISFIVPAVEEPSS